MDLSCKNRGAAPSEDRISSLPEPILGHILSYLPTDEAIRTSIIARKWRYIWKSVHTLHLNLDRIQRRFKIPQGAASDSDSSTHSKKRRIEGEIEMEKTMNRQIINFSNKVLALLREANIRKVSVVYTSHAIWHRKALSHAIKDWISTAAACKAHELDLCLTDIQFPLYFFSNESLEALKLDLHRRPLELPAAVGFNKLKTMHLVYVEFVDENLTRQLFSNSPVLEHVVINNCFHRHDFKLFEISSPSLKSLVIKIDTYEYESDELDLCESDGLSSCELKIFAPLLESFSHEGVAAGDYTMGEFPFINSASVHCYANRWRTNHSAKLMAKVFDHMHRVEVLKMCGVCIKAFLPPSDSFGCFCSPFNQLTHLELNVEFFGKSLPAILFLLKTNDRLHTLVINLKVPDGFEYYHISECGCDYGGPCYVHKPTDDENREKYLGFLKMFAGHRMQNLRRLEMKSIEGELEIDFLKLLLEAQLYLEILSVSISLKYHIRHPNIGEELLDSPRASPSLAVMLVVE